MRTYRSNRIVLCYKCRREKRQGVIIMEKKMLELKERIEQADAVIIGAGAGFSTAAGFVYTGERFDRYFSDFSRKYANFALLCVFPKLFKHESCKP